jgi:hypothetical protein
MQINKGCSIEFFSARTILAVSIKRNFRFTRLMRRSLQVVIRQRFVILDVIAPAHPPRLMLKEFQLLVYIFIFLGVEMTD